MLRFYGREAKWGEFVYAKINFPEVLSREIRRKRAPLGKVILGTVTDAYQPAEGEYGLTRASLRVLAEERPEINIDLLTKSDLVVRDIELFKQLRNCSVGFTLTTPDDAVANIVEPGAAPPSARLQAAKKLAGEGISVWVFIAPILPGLTDAPGALEELLASLRDIGVREVYLDPLNPYPAAVERLRITYEQKLSWALTHLERFLRDPRGYLKLLAKKLETLSRRYKYNLKL
ncbi:MAG: radical SAM protein [Thermanaeromonas sp.]|nr:radical SAM protein [Thermanaeromonas sp.]